MCLFNSAFASKKFINKYNDNDLVINAYKVVTLEYNVVYESSCKGIGLGRWVGKFTGKIIGPFKNFYTYKQGWNKSNSQRKKPSLKNEEINRGIHVCLTLKQAQNIQNLAGRRRIVKVQCLLEDFVGTDGDQAVFIKVFIPKKEFGKLKKEIARGP